MVIHYSDNFDWNYAIYAAILLGCITAPVHLFVHLLQAVTWKPREKPELNIL